MGCMRLRGSAKALDVAKLMFDQHWAVKQQVTFMQFVETELKRMDLYFHHLCPDFKDPVLNQSHSELTKTMSAKMASFSRQISDS